MNLGYGASLSQKRIDQNSEPGKALQKVVQVKLKDFLGQDYADDVLPLYIVVMLAHGNQADLVADNLEAFLGQAPAQLFVQWYTSKLTPPLHINNGAFANLDTCAGCSSISQNQERNMPHQITRATDLRHLLRLTTVRRKSLALRTVKPAQWKKTKDLNQGSHIVEQSLTASSSVLVDRTICMSSRPIPALLNQQCRVFGSPEEAPHAQTEVKHASQRAPVSQLQSSGVNSQETTERRYDRRSRRSPSLLRSVMLALTTKWLISSPKPCYAKSGDSLAFDSTCSITMLHSHAALVSFTCTCCFVSVLSLCAASAMLRSTCSILCNHTNIVQG